MTHNDGTHESTEFSAAGRYNPGPAPYQQVDAAQRANWRAKGTRRIVAGVIWFVAGLLITLITLANSVNGGYYVIAFGPMIYGVIQVFHGIHLYGKGDA